VCKPANAGRSEPHDIRVIAESLHAAVPKISMNVVVEPRWHSQELKVPYSRQCETEDDDAAFGNSGVEKSSRMAKRYAMPATARGTKNDGSLVRLKLREQIVSATSKMTPSPYSLCTGVSFTGLP